jgi:hypothetical protein
MTATLPRAARSFARIARGLARVVDHRKAIEQKIAGQEIERVEVEARPPTTDLVATLKASLGRKELAKVPAASKSKPEPVPAKRPARRRRVS